MRINHSFIGSFYRRFLHAKVKFAGASAVATSVDYGLYLLLLRYKIDPVLAHAISYSCGMVTNFTLQKQFIFELNRPISSAFLFSAGFAGGALLLGTGFMKMLLKVPFFAEMPVAGKVLTTGILFLYNFYTRRFSFEKR
jgi:putative flippase GtrA